MPPKPPSPPPDVPRVFFDPRKMTSKEIADAMNAIRREARRKAGLPDD